MAAHALAAEASAVLRGSTPPSVLARRPVRRAAAARHAFRCEAKSQDDRQYSATSLTLNGALALVSSLALAGPAGAADLDLDSLVASASDNPLVLVGAAAAVAVPVAASALAGALSGGSKIKATTVEKILEAMKEESRVLLVDIRNKETVKETGSPDLRAVKRKAISVPFTKVVEDDIEVVDDWVEKLQANSAVKEDSILVLLDAYGNDAPKAAKLVAAATEADTVYYVTDGAEGPNGWRAMGGGWKEPSKGLEFALPSLSLPKLSGEGLEAFAEDFKASPSLLKAGVAVGGVVAAGALLVSEVELLLELVGVVAAGRFLLTNLLFASDRERLLKEVKRLIDEKIVAGDAGEDLKKLAATVLDVKVKDAPAELAAGAAPAAATSSNGAVPSTSNAVDERKAEVQKWIDAYRSRSSDAPDAAAPAEAPAAAAAPGGADSLAARKAEVQEWIAAYRARSGANVAA